MPTSNPCPCDSGFEYDACCGAADRSAREAVAVFRAGAAPRPENLTPQLRVAVENVASRPDLFPARINFAANTAYWVKMSRRWYAESVFLDPARILASQVIETDLEWMREAADRTPWQSAGYIFHTAFCGSTLMSQALFDLYRCLPLREPDALGNLMFYLRSRKNALPDRNEWVGRIVRLLARRYEPDAPAIIKANDYANGLIEDVLGCRSDIPVLFMYTPLAEFVVGCVKAENRRSWIRDRYSTIRTGAARLLPVPPALAVDDNAVAEMASVYWSYNIALYLAARRVAPDRLRSLDFNRMLERPREMVDASAAFFGLASLPATDGADRMAALLGVYSKNPEFRYSPEQRRNELDRSFRKYATEIEAAERLARVLLAEHYPDNSLPGRLE